jgi:hypothetical protein
MRLKEEVLHSCWSNQHSDASDYQEISQPQQIPLKEEHHPQKRQHEARSNHHRTHLRIAREVR